MKPGQVYELVIEPSAFARALHKTPWGPKVESRLDDDLEEISNWFLNSGEDFFGNIPLDTIILNQINREDPIT